MDVTSFFQALIRWRRLVVRPLLLTQLLALKIGYRLRPLHVPWLPATLDIEPNNNCNYKCPHCQVTHWAKRQVHLHREAFERILGQFPRLAWVKLQGMGEPLLNKQMLPMLKTAAARDIPTVFTTNGSIMTGDIAEQLAGLKKTTITFSIDGATADVFEEIRVGGKFHKVCDNIRRLIASRGAARQPVIQIWTVVTQRNVAELPAIVRLANDLGADAITFQLFISNWGKTAMEPRAEATRVGSSDPQLAAALSEAQSVAQTLGIPLTIHHDNFMSPEKPCSWPWTSAYIASNGDVVPCCMVADSDTVRMGNVFEQPFRQIWNGPAYRQLREQIRSHRLPHFCRNCYGERDLVAPLQLRSREAESSTPK